MTAMRESRTEIWASVDPDLCAAVTMCSAMAPSAFRLEGDVSVYVADNDATADEILEAAESCPMAAITVTEERTGEQLFPDKPSLQS